MAVGSDASTKPSRSSFKRGTRLWLTLLENERRVEWPPTINGQKWEVQLNSSDTLQGCNHAGLYRTSPVFAATSEFSLPDLKSGTYYFCFFCFDPAFPILGRLVRRAPAGLRSGLLYTIGLASILLVTRKPSFAKKVIEIAGELPRAKEIWRVDRGQVKAISCECSPPLKLDPQVLRVRSYELLPIVAKTTVDEFVANLAVIMPKIRVHVPTEAATFVRLVKLVNELIEEMLYVCDPNGAPPETLSDYTREQFEKYRSLQNRILHQNTDRLVQINAALSYVSTQALSGAVPILDRRSLIRRYSLLGVGTAVLALNRIAHSIEGAFAAGALEEIIKDRADQAIPLPGLDDLPEHDSRKWPELSINQWNGRVRARNFYPKLPYYSGRFGFRETEYTISAALQTLAAGASAEWSLLTVTHEMVHGHVRNILSMLFQGDPSRRSETKWEEFYRRFEARLEKNPPTNESLLDSLRTIILTYCCNVIKHGSLTRDMSADFGASPAQDAECLSDADDGDDGNDVSESDDDHEREVQIDFVLPQPEGLWQAYAAEYRNISEIFVHILDLHYFYCSCLTHYIPLIWRSWSTAPQVRGDLRQYLLRSLLVVATKTSGTAYERFREARSKLVELLESIGEEDAAQAPVIEVAIKRLKRTAYCEKRLFYPFSASIILVDLVHNVLTSNAIRGAINAGDHHFRTVSTLSEDWLDYDMPDGFVDDVVISPTAYMAHNLTRTTSRKSGQDVEAETAALFLACSSRLFEGAHND